MSAVATPVELGGYGVWARNGALTGPDAAEIERLGYGAIWVGGSPAADLGAAEEVLAATEQIGVATGIVNIWAAPPHEVAASYARLEERYPGRFLLGIGAGHRETDGAAAVTPFRALEDYLDALDENGVPADRRVLAALGPRVLRLSAERAAGAHPYLATPEHTRLARAELGPGPLLAPEQKVVLGAEPEETRATARTGMGFYLGIQNYRANLLRLGFTDDELSGDGADSAIDALVAQGTAEDAAMRLRAHAHAGADHVAVQALPDPEGILPALRELAPALGLRVRT